MTLLSEPEKEEESSRQSEGHNEDTHIGLDNAKVEAASGGMKSYLRVFRYADRLSWTLNIIAFAAAIASGTLLPLMDFIFGKFVTAFTQFATGAKSPADFRAEVNKYTLYYVYLFIGKFVLFYIHSVFISVAAIRTTKALRVDYIKHTLRQNIAYFDSAEAVSVTANISTNSNNVNNGIAEKLTLTIQGVSTIIGAFIVAFTVQWKLTLITIPILPAIILVIGICVGIEEKNESQMNAIYTKASQLAEEVFSTMRTVHSFWLHTRLSKQYNAMLGDAMRVGMKKSPNYAIMFSTEFFCIYCGYALAFWQGIRRYVSGEITSPGDVFTVILAVVLASTSMTILAPQIITLTKSASAAEELFKIIDRKSTIDPLSESGERPDECAGRIEIQNIDFAYPTRPNVPILKKFSLSAPENSTTAIVGASGSGKSTIVGLLERWYEANDGKITIDGVQIQNINLTWLRTNIRLVQQEPVLFSGSVFENVACGLAGSSKAKLPVSEQRALVEKACKAAYADEFVERLPKGYDTQIGERAMTLSGGQKQRLAIARSIISDPRVLLLDEATSALDPKAEKMVQQALDSVSRNRTTIVIAHKLSTIRNADNIAVMSDGCIIEQGTHDQLIEQGGAYARLVRAQDLSQPRGADEFVDSKEMGEQPTLVKTRTQVASIHDTSAKSAGTDSLNYSLIRCIIIVFWEHRGLWPSFLALGIASIIGGCTYPAKAILFGRIARAFELQGSEAIDRGDYFSLMFFIIAIGNLLAFSIIGWFSTVVIQHVSRRYRLEIFQLILKQDMDFFDEEDNASGALASNLSSHPNSLTELLGFNIMLIMINIFSVLSSSILAIIVGWKLGLAIVFGALPLVVFLGYLRIRLEGKLEEDTGKRFKSSAALASEAVLAIRTVSSLALERHIIEKYEDRLQGVAKQSMKALITTMFWYSLTQSMSFLAMALGFWYGGQLLSRHEYSTTQFYTVFLAVIFSGEAAASFFSYTTSMSKAGTAANYIFWLRSLRPAVEEDPSKPPSDDEDQSSPAHMNVQDLTFAYPTRPNAKVLEDINVDVRPGKFIAFVGASGCGKSTMVSLLERFYDPLTGCITCEGRSLTELCPRKYRRHVSLVQQEPVLYQGSIRDNIAMGMEDEVTDEEVDEAARQSNIYTFVTSLPEGFNTLCGTKGTQLSGGQRQRLAIARALIRRPRLLLLDEATSALDTESEEIVQAALETAKSGRTTIAVAHRLSTIKDADTIIVFARGKIMEVGTHSELLAKKGMYFEMCLGQSLDRSIPA